MQSSDSNSQTLLREGLSVRASEPKGLDLQFEDAQTDTTKQQSASALDAAVALARGKSVDKQVTVPFEVVTPENMDNYAHQH
ncbi:ABC-type sugar transport system substrate-binding protein [Mesorhizobium sp. RMAD-H1]|nr:ABC-type sugar transport system substrate-binding protein [Mesorhizobium sp. RMAD-H1]